MADPTRVTQNHVAAVLGLSWRKAGKSLRRVYVVYPPDGSGLYDARVLDLLRAMRGQPHRELSPVENDWLSRYLKEIDHASSHPRT